VHSKSSHIGTPATADASCLGMTNGGAVFGVSAIAEHLYYCSTYILLLSCRGTRHLYKITYMRRFGMHPFR